MNTSERERWAKAYAARLKMIALDLQREAALERKLATERDDITPFIPDVEEWEVLAASIGQFTERLGKIT